MKKIRSLCILFVMGGICLFPSRLYGRGTSGDEGDARVNVKLNGLALIGIVNPAVEFRVFDRGTVQLEGIGIFYPSGFPGTDKPMTLGATSGEFRFYPKRAFEGFYAGANAGWGVYRLAKSLSPGYSHQHPDQYQVGHNMIFGATLGYTFNFGRHWSIEISWSGGWQDSTYEGFNNDGTRYVKLNGSGEWLPIYKGGIFVGYKF